MFLFQSFWLAIQFIVKIEIGDDKAAHKKEVAKEVNALLESVKGGFEVK